jgi:hypothetical protein
MTDVSPNLWIFLIVALDALALMMALGFLLLKRKSLSQARWKWQAWLSLGAVALIGAILIVKESQGLYAISEKKQWTQVSGKILASEMRGRKAYIPFVKYEYEFGGKIYAGETELYSPQWGGKLLRKETSENILAMFKPESAILVYVNPKNESESALEIHFGWDLFIRLGVGAFLWVLANAVLLVGALQPLFLHKESSIAKT